MNDYLKCDVCISTITDYSTDLYHATTLLNGKIEKHTHLCKKCYMKYVKDAPTINTKGINYDR